MSKKIQGDSYDLTEFGRDLFDLSRLITLENKFKLTPVFKEDQNKEAMNEISDFIKENLENFKLSHYSSLTNLYFVLNQKEKHQLMRHDTRFELFKIINSNITNEEMR